MTDEKKTEQDWAPEPWEWNGEILCGADGIPIQCPSGIIDDDVGRRIEACVNACKGIPMEKLNQIARGELMAIIIPRTSERIRHEIMEILTERFWPD